jgi:gamma-glutamylcyclotransferase (GGCT)/AIG2-like uncharacterized protein YtfP
MFPRVLQRVIGSRVRGTPAILQGYGRYRLRKQVYPGIVERPGEAVEGVLYCGLSRAQWRRMDAFEGRSYRRQRVSVQGPRGTSVTAWTYVIAGRHRLLVGRQPWDHSRFARRHLRRSLSEAADSV